MSYRIRIDSVNEKGIKPYNTLSIVIDDIIVRSYDDNGEPEDNLFTRDYDWIKEELERAYKKGFSDGEHKQIIKHSWEDFLT